jgi:formylglycine-generating enzyme required for sulfatase activity
MKFSTEDLPHSPHPALPMPLNLLRRKLTAQFYPEPLSDDITLDMVLIKGGTFTMGSPDNEPERNQAEGPQHDVTLPNFFMGKYPVTQEQWQVVAGYPQANIELNPTPSKFKGVNLPVEQISWHEAVEFCQRLSAKIGRTYRLPSEAQWEYACRARTTTPFAFGNTLSPDLANYNGNYSYNNGPKGDYRETTTAVGTFPANAFGLYDMHGNVYEWCEDHWRGSYIDAPTDGNSWLEKGLTLDTTRVLRGGSWIFNPWWCRSACRDHAVAGARRNLIGFRVCIVDCFVPRSSLR